MGINQLQLPSTQPFMTDLNLNSSLSQLGQVYKQAQKEQKLSDLGKQLASGTVDYRTAAGQVADMGDVGNTLKFLELAEQQKRQAEELTASREFNNSLSSMYGGQTGPAASAPTTTSFAPASAVPPQVASAGHGAPAAMASVDPGAPMAAPRAPVMPSAKVWGDQEAEAAGLYESVAPVRVTSANPTIMTDAGPALLPSTQPAGAVAQSATPSTRVDLPSVSPRALQLIAASGNLRLPQAQRDTARVLLNSELDGSKATSDMKEWAFAKSQDPNTPDYTTWTRENKAAGKTTVTIDQKGEAEFEKEFGKGQAKRWNGYIEEGQNAERKLADINSMREISQRMGSQGAKANLKEAIGPYAEALGIPIDGLSDVQAYSSVIQRLAPAQRAPGSGSTSDIEFKGFLKSLPTLSQNPQARDVTLNTMEAFARDDMARGEVAARLATKEINRGQAEKEIRALPDPMKAFSEWRKENPQLYGQALKGASAAKTGDKAKLAPFSKVEIDQSLSNAKAAITANPSARDAIIKKLLDNGLDASGL